jgi:hypothetical protein
VIIKESYNAALQLVVKLFLVFNAVGFGLHLKNPLPPTAKLKLLPAPARARIIPPHLGRTADYCLGNNVPLIVKPLAVLLFKPGPLVVTILQAITLVDRFKFNGALGITNPAFLNRNNLQTQPAGFFAPVFGLLDVNVIFVFMDASVDDVIYRVFGVGGIAAAHEGFGGGGLGCSGDVGFAAF